MINAASKTKAMFQYITIFNPSNSLVTVSSNLLFTDFCVILVLVGFIIIAAKVRIKKDFR